MTFLPIITTRRLMTTLQIAVVFRFNNERLFVFSSVKICCSVHFNCMCTQRNIYKIKLLFFLHYLWSYLNYIRTTFILILLQTKMKLKKWNVSLTYKFSHVCLKQSDPRTPKSSISHSVITSVTNLRLASLVIKHQMSQNHLPAN